AFRHALTQEVALASLLGDAKRRIHRRVAEAMVETEPERHDERAAEIARHFDEAEETERALSWYRRAVAWAGASYPRLSIEWWERVRALATELGRSDLALEAFAALLQERSRMGLSEAELGEMMGELMSLGDPSRLFHVFEGLQTVYFFQGRYREASEFCHQALAIAESSGDTERLGALRFFASLLKGLRGRTGEVLVELEASVYEGSPGSGLLVHQPFFVAAMRGFYFAMAGRLGAGVEALDRAQEIATKVRQPLHEAFIENYRSTLAWLAGDAVAQLRHARRCAELERELGSTAGAVMALAALARAELDGGNAEGARELGMRALAQLREANTFRVVEPFLLYTLAQAHAELDRGDEAIALAREGLALEESRDQQLAWGPLAVALVLLAVEGADARNEVRRLLGRAREWIERFEQRGQLPRLNELEAELARVLGDPAEQLRHLRAARNAAREVGAGPRAERLEAELARLESGSA
ncbi:MAG: hypothetical protein ABFS41_18760, partial [Myxococcota bacterium]